MGRRFTVTANFYFTHQATNTGHFTAPFADTCERYENGGRTTKKAPDFFKTPLTYENSELFQTKAHKINPIKAVVINVPYKMTADVRDE